MVTFIIYTLLVWLLQCSAAELPSFRLDGSVIPHHYNLEISTGLNHDDFKFWGTVEIHISCMKDTNRIVLHSRNLTIQEKNVTLTEDVSSKSNIREGIEIVSHAYNTTDDFYIVQTESILQAGRNYTYTIPFTGVLNTAFDGFYRSHYDDEETKRRIYLGTTHFEPANARQAFPCFDEPKMKATFTTTIGHLQNYTALSNMPLEKTIPLPNKPGWVLSRFAKSVRMSTYLVAFVVSDFTHRTTVKSKRGIEIRIWAKRDSVKRNHTEFAEQYAPKVLDFFEKYFEIPFPLPKIDMIAIPYFKGEGMENWGLITYTESALLYDPMVTPHSDLEDIAITIAHELSHQWFGNLVTMEWWSELWLNEGFASYKGYVGTHAIYPEWNVIERKFGSVIDLAFVKKLEVSILFPSDMRPNDFVALFGSTTYNLGPAIVRMIVKFLGEDAYREGLTIYFNKHKYGNVIQEDLYEALTESAHKKGVLDPNITVEMIMDPWIKQIGYPLLTVHRNYDDGTVAVSQVRLYCNQRPFSRKNGTKETSQNAVWWIPLTFATEDTFDFSKTIPSDWLTEEGPMTVPHLKIKDREWIIFNNQMSALYKVYYNPQNWKLLEKALQDEETYLKIHPFNRRQIIADVFDLAGVGHVPYETVFSLSKYIRHETEYLPLSAAHSRLREIDLKLRRTPSYGQFKNYMKELVKPTVARAHGLLAGDPQQLKVIEEKHLYRELASYYDIGTYKDEAVKLFRLWYESNDPDISNPIPKEIRKDVSCTAMQEGGEEEWNFLWTRFLNSKLAIEKSHILSALTCSRKVSILEQFLDRSIDESSGILPQDSVSIFKDVALNEAGFTIAKNFLMNRVADIHAFHGPRNYELGRYVRALADQMITKEEFDEVKAFTEKYPEFFDARHFEIKDALVTIDDNVKWYESFHDEIPKILRTIS